MILDDELKDISEYQPTRKQSLTKLKLHQYVNPQIIGSLTPLTLPKIRQYLYPTTVEEVERWAASEPIFWYWFIMPNEQVEKLNALKNEAVDTLSKLMTEEIIDGKAAQVKLKVAQLVLGISEKPQVQTTVTKNTMHVQGLKEIPKALEKKSHAELHSEIMRLNQAHNLSEPDI